MDTLPFLPGNTFKDVTKTDYHRIQHFDYHNGYQLHKLPRIKDPVAPLTSQEINELAAFKPILTYGHTKHPTADEFVPSHVFYDKKILKFDAYLQETVTESNIEYYRYHFVNIYYFLEDDSIIVDEPRVINSGMTQGKMINRLRLPKNDQGDYWHWTDLNIGTSVTFYGRVFRIINCDKWTRDFLTSEGVVVNPPEEKPIDTYTEKRAKDFFRPTGKTGSSFDKLRQFLDYDKKILAFKATWDKRKFIIYYHLADDNIEVKEVYEENSGRDPFPLFLRRSKVPKDRTKPDEGFYGPEDFAVGKSVDLYDKRFFIYDCDNFTKAFYYKYFGITDFTPVNIETPPAKLPEREIPPPTPYGSLEDSFQSCITVFPRPPKRKIKIMNDINLMLRYLATLESCEPGDEDRRFTISYYIYDDTIRVYELATRRSGRITGMFLERVRIPKPDTDPANPVYYGPQDFYIGAKVIFFTHRFTIIDADPYVLEYAEEYPEKFPEETLKSLREKLSDFLPKEEVRKENLSNIAKYIQKQLQEWLHSNKSCIQLMFLEADKARKGYIDREQLRLLCRQANIAINDALLDTLMCEVVENDDGRISFTQFSKFISR